MFREIPVERRDPRGSKRKLIHGVGINDAPYQTSYTVGDTKVVCPYFSRWSWMLSRCYSASWLKRHPTYIGCYVTDPWLVFTTFKQWMETQDWVGKQLDKDLLSKGSKVYSPATCLFVSRQVNSLFNARDHGQGDLPLGIYQRGSRYEVGCSMGKGKRTWIGSYSTMNEAIDAYNQAKLQAARKVANRETDPKVRTAILDYAKYFTDRQSLLKT